MFFWFPREPNFILYDYRSAVRADQFSILTIDQNKVRNSFNFELCAQFIL